MQRFLTKHLIIIKWTRMPSLMLRHFYLCHNLIQWLLNGGTAAPLGNGRDTWQCLGMCLVVMSGERQESRLTPKVHVPSSGGSAVVLTHLIPVTAPRGGSSCPGTDEEQEPQEGHVAFPRPQSLRRGTQSPCSPPSSCAAFSAAWDAQDPGLLLQQMPFPFMALEAPLSGCAQRPGNCHRGLIHFAIPG